MGDRRIELRTPTVSIQVSPADATLVRLLPERDALPASSRRGFVGASISVQRRGEDVGSRGVVIVANRKRRLSMTTDSSIRITQIDMPSVRGRTPDFHDAKRR